MAEPLRPNDPHRIGAGLRLELAQLGVRLALRVERCDHGVLARVRVVREHEPLQPRVGRRSLRGALRRQRFRNGGADWRELAWIKHPSDLTYDIDYIRVAISGDHFVVGVPQEDGTTRGVGGTSNATPSRNTDRGAAFVYRRAGGTWLFDSYLKASNPDDGDVFGASVAIDDNHIFVTAPNEDGGGTSVDDFANPSGGMNSGAAYFFVPSP